MVVRDSVDYVAQERIGQLARTYWLPSADLHAANEREASAATATPESVTDARPFDLSMMERIYREELLTSGFSHRRCLALELNQYLERWLWPYFEAETSARAHVLSICAMVNEKSHGRVPIWQIFVASPDKFNGLVQRVLRLLLEESPQLLAHQGVVVSPSADSDANANAASVDTSQVQYQKLLLEHIVLVIFLSHCFTNLAEVGVLRQCLRELYSLSVWRHLRPVRLDRELALQPKYARILAKLQKHQLTRMTDEQRENLAIQHSFVPRMVDTFVGLLESIPEQDKFPVEQLLVHYLERFILLLIDLESMLLTRRLLHAILDDRHVVVRCQQAGLTRRRPEGKLFCELVDMLAFYTHFQINEITGEALDDGATDKRHCADVSALQLEVFSAHRDKLLSFSVSNPAGIESSSQLRKHLSKLKVGQLHALAAKFALVSPALPPEAEVADERNAKATDEEDGPSVEKRVRLEATADVGCASVATRLYASLEAGLLDKEMLLRILIHRFAKRQSELELTNSTPLYPTEELIWDENRVPTEFYSGEACLALPKLGLQFLTLQDYLLRNFNLFRLESTYQIRQDIEDAVLRLKPWCGELGQTVFDGWSRMALPIQSFNIIEVAKPHLGTYHPSRVRADVRVALAGLRPEVRKEWLGLRRHDPMFLVTVRPTKSQGWKYDKSEHFMPQVGLVYVRGCEIEGQVDKEGKLVSDEERFGFIPTKGEKPNLVATLPTWRVYLDAAQYQSDADRLRAEQTRGEVLRAKCTRAKREGRPLEEIKQLEAEAAQAEYTVHEDLYNTFNILIRRKPKENNFKAVLDTIRDLMNTQSVVPDWLLDLLMGYLDPAAAHYSRRADVYETRQNWFDTFLSADHVRTAFPQYSVRFVDKRRQRYRQHQHRQAGAIACPDDDAAAAAAGRRDGDPEPPYRLIFPPLSADTTARAEAMVPSDMVSQEITTAAAEDRQAKKAEQETSSKPCLVVEAYEASIKPPLDLLLAASGGAAHQPLDSLSSGCRGNRVPFTTAQVGAIRSAMQPGLTLVVGPPGTGKTDVAVQIIHNLYHNYPNQRILIVTHSNQALNQLFEKIINLNIDERHLLRLGHGEEGLDTEKDFSRYGRVDYILTKRIQLLQEVTRLAKSLTEASTAEDPSQEVKEDAPADQLQVDEQSTRFLHTCETAQYFFVQHVLSRWEDFVSKMASKVSSRDGDASAGDNGPDTATYDPSFLRTNFPFMEFFTGHRLPSPEIMQQLFPGRSLIEDMAMARACFNYIHSIIVQLDEFRAFELMRTGAERANYLLMQEAKIIAMTCTHAALRRRDLVQMNFTYDTILMEEAAQILEIETFIPLLLQNPDLSGRNRLKRWIMIGDHHQLPPVVKNLAFNNYSNMGQSLFTRLVKLGVPAVQLDAQGRARPSLSSLYSWRYRNLRDLPHTLEEPRFRLANPGFRYDVQLINVEDYKGTGESEPSAHFFQNLAEAEYIVAVYMYMRILGYPADRITILTTYNGQKHLIRDVITARCANNPLLGSPSNITTVDRFQGQQNDYVLVSLVRTRTVGHLRDVRRLIVALSRARLGLYIFARISQFATCPELKPAFDLLLNVRCIGGPPKPVYLHLTPWEMWMDPTNPPANHNLRRQGDPLTNQLPLVINDMPQMTAYVHQLYEQRLNNLMTRVQQETQKKKAIGAPVSGQGTTLTEKPTDEMVDTSVAGAAEIPATLPGSDASATTPLEEQGREDQPMLVDGSSGVGASATEATD